ncbi:MAG: hypothetical protein ACJ72O_00855 [Marmoricola sp.]
MRTVRTALLGAFTLALCLTATGCGGGGHPKPPRAAEPTSLAQLHPDRMRVVRVAFCDLVPRRAVRAALAAAPTRTSSWHNGDPVAAAGGELGHEFGCSWSGPHGRLARAWVFARPVSPAFARTLVRAADRDPGCTARAGTRFGHPSLVQSCVRSGAPRRTRLAGLFGDTWLSCEVAGHGPATALRQRADAWCVSVADALDAG